MGVKAHINLARYLPDMQPDRSLWTHRSNDSDWMAAAFIRISVRSCLFFLPPSLFIAQSG